MMGDDDFFMSAITAMTTAEVGFHPQHTGHITIWLILASHHRSL